MIYSKAWEGHPDPDMDIVDRDGARHELLELFVGQPYAKTTLVWPVECERGAFFTII